MPFRISWNKIPFVLLIKTFRNNPKVDFEPLTGKEMWKCRSFSKFRNMMLSVFSGHQSKQGFAFQTWHDTYMNCQGRWKHCSNRLTRHLSRTPLTGWRWAMRGGGKYAPTTTYKSLEYQKVHMPSRISFLHCAPSILGKLQAKDVRDIPRPGMTRPKGKIMWPICYLGRRQEPNLRRSWND